MGRKTKIALKDFSKFDYIFGMDGMNITELQQLAPKNCKAKIELLGNYGNSEHKIISDPYFEKGFHGFIRCYDQIYICCKNFLEIQLTKIV